MGIRIGTRGSELALWQARALRDELHRACATHAAATDIEIIILETKGDQIQDVPLTPDLGRSFFTKEIEDALLQNEVDVAVHSLKDLAVEQPAGLCLGAVLPRANPGERLLIHPSAFVPNKGYALPLKPGARVGTSSPRRRRRLLELVPDLELLELRGNVPTRVRKVLEGQYDAILLACAGLDRLGVDLAGLASVDLDLDLFPGAPGQGAIGIQCREEDCEIKDILLQINDLVSMTETRVERGLLQGLGGGCSLPIGAYAQLRGKNIHLNAFTFPVEQDSPSLAISLVGTDPAAIIIEASELLAASLDQVLAGKRFIVLGGSAKSTVERDLLAAGAEVMHVSCYDLAAQSLRDPDLEQVLSADHLLFASETAVEILAKELMQKQRNLPPTCGLLTPGRRTAESARRHFPGHEVLVADPPRNMGMGMLAIDRGAKRVVGLGAKDGNTDGLKLAKERGIEASHVALYRVVEKQPDDDLASLGASAIPVYLSPAATRVVAPSSFADAEEIIAIGPSTAQSLGAPALEEGAKTKIRVASRPDLWGILDALRVRGSLE